MVIVTGAIFCYISALIVAAAIVLTLIARCKLSRIELEQGWKELADCCHKTLELMDALKASYNTNTALLTETTETFEQLTQSIESDPKHHIMEVIEDESE